MQTIAPAPFALTDRATARIAEILAAGPAGQALRLSVLAGGCNGFHYRFELDAPAEEDWRLEQGGAVVAIDPTSLDLIAGGTLDYTDELMGAHFTVSNPQAATSCGCGSSFSLG